MLVFPDGIIQHEHFFKLAILPFELHLEELPRPSLDAVDLVVKLSAHVEDIEI